MEREKFNFGPINKTRPPSTRCCHDALPLKKKMPMDAERTDGYLSRLLPCPDLIIPRNWLPHVWRTAEGENPGISISPNTEGTTDQNHRQNHHAGNQGHYNSVPTRQ